MGKHKYDYWGYSDSEDVGTPQRLNLRRVAFCDITTFLRTLDSGQRGIKQWIRARMAVTGNPTEINLVNKHPNKLLSLEANTYKVVGISDLVGKGGIDMNCCLICGKLVTQEIKHECKLDLRNRKQLEDFNSMKVIKVRRG